MTERKELRCAFCDKLIAKDVSNSILVKEKWFCSKECADAYYNNQHFSKPH